MFIYALLNILSYCVSLLGFQGISILSKILAFITFDILRVRQSIIMQNLNLVFENSKTLKEKKEIGRASIASFIATSLEFIGAKRLFPKAKVNYIHSEYMRNALDKNEGLYTICIHMSNWEYLCHINSTIYGPVHVVVKNIGKGSSAKWIEDLRTYIGYRLIQRKSEHKATTQIFRVIENKGILGFIADQKRPRGEQALFFKKLASSNNSLIKLYLRKKAPIIPAIIKRMKPGEFEVVYFPEFQILEDKTLSHQQIVSLNTLRMNELIEKMILENPKEYFWMHNRWDFKK